MNIMVQTVLRVLMVRETPYLPLLVLMISMAVMHCAADRHAVKPSESAPAEAEVEEADFDVLAQLGEDFTIPPPSWKVESIPIDTALPPEISRIEVDTSVHKEDEKVTGWRIQIFASDNFESAAAFQEQARLEFSESGVYLAYDPPNYKIRIGDCQNRIDAESLLRRIRQMGYPDAFLVPSRVYLYPELRMQSMFGADSLANPVDSTGESDLLSP